MPVVICEYGGDKSAYPLHGAAAESNEKGLARQLKNATAGSGQMGLEQLDEQACTPLHYACYMGATKCVALLLQAGASVVTADGVDAGTALHFASWKGDWPDCIQMLLDKKANKKAKNRQGWTPLQYAKKGKHASSIALLDPPKAAGGKKGRKGGGGGGKTSRGETLRRVLQSMEDGGEDMAAAEANKLARREALAQRIVDSGAGVYLPGSACYRRLPAVLTGFTPHRCVHQVASTARATPRVTSRGRSCRIPPRTWSAPARHPLDHNGPHS